MRKLIIRIDPQVWKTARELGINISRICENVRRVQELAENLAKSAE